MSILNLTEELPNLSMLSWISITTLTVLVLTPFVWTFSTNRVRNKMAVISQTAFYMHVSEWNVWLSNKICLKCVPCVLIDNMKALVQITGRKDGSPLSDPMITQFTDAYTVALLRPKELNIMFVDGRKLCSRKHLILSYPWQKVNLDTDVVIKLKVMFMPMRTSIQKMLTDP